MEWFAAAGIVCFVLAALGVVAVVAIFRAAAAAGGRGAVPFAAMVTIGVLAPILFLAGVVLLGTANSGTFGR